MEKPSAILLSSFAVHPTMPSEPGVGWEFLLQTALFAKERGERVLLLTIKRSADAVASKLAELGLAETVNIVTVRLPINPPFFRWHNPRFTRFEHLMWAASARKVLHRLEQQYDIRYAHHVTFATELLPPPIVYLGDATYKVWGPVGAGGVAGVYLLKPINTKSVKQAILQFLRDLTVRYPAAWSAKRVDLVLAQNAATSDLIARTKCDVEIFPNVIVNSDIYDSISQHENRRPKQSESENSRRNADINILSVGHLIPRKRLEVGVKSLTNATLATSTYHIVGDPINGKENSTRKYAETLGVHDRVVFHGKIDRLRVVELMSTCDVLFHPSGREGASGVVGEATACGLPVVCFEGTGAASVLDQSVSSGISLPLDIAKTPGMIPAALIKAAEMPRTRTYHWDVDRIADLVKKLSDTADRKANKLGQQAGGSSK